MSQSLYAWVLFGLYVVAVIAIAVRAKRAAKSMESYSVGSRQVSPYVVGLSLAASMTSAATFVINPGLIYLYGWAGVLGYAVASPVGIFLALIVFSKAFRRLGDRTNVLTVPQWIGDRYGDRRLTVFFAVLSLLQVTFLVLIAVGLAVVLKNALGIPVLAALVLVVGFTFSYILAGGAAAHIRTNQMQALIMIAVALIFLGSGAHLFSGGIGGFAERLAAVGPHYASPTNPDSLLFRNLFEVVVANFAIGVAIILQPHIVSKALYLRSEADVNRYLVTSIAVATLFFAVLVTGLFARLTLTGELLPPDVVIATYMVERFSPFVRALVMLGVLAAGFSTMEGILVALSSIFANDLLRNVLPGARANPDAWRERSLRYARAFLVVLAPVTIWLSWRQIVSPSLSVAIFAQNGVYGLFAATFVPILFGIFVPRSSRWVVLAASLTALTIHFGMYYAKVGAFHNNPAVPATLGLVGSVLVGVVGTALTGGFRGAGLPARAPRAEEVAR